MRYHQVTRLDFGRERFIYMKERDRKDQKLLEKKEENIHLERIRRFDYMLKKMEMMHLSHVKKNKD